MKLKIFFCQFPNAWALRVSGMGGYTSKCEKSQNHCTLLLRPRTFVHYSFSMISSRPEGLPKSPRPRLFKPEWASNIRRQFLVLEKKHFYTWCAGLIVHALLTIYRVPQCMSPSRNWDSTTPSPPASVPLPPTEGGRAHSPAGEGWGSPIPTTGEKA
jgi:hypothetical protein